MDDAPLEFELHSYVDGVLDEEAMARIEQYLLVHPDMAAKVQAYLRDKRSLRDYASDAPLPPSAAIGKLQGQLAKRLKRPKFLRWPQAAVWAFVFATAGWLSHTVYAHLADKADFGHEMAVAHNLAAEGLTTPTPVAQDQVTKLFARIGEPARLPDLRRFGMRAVAAQLLPSDQGPILHILYRNSAGATLSYFLQHDHKAAEVPLQILHPEGMTMASWQHDYSRHAVAAPLSDVEVKGIAEHLNAALGSPGA